MLWINKQAAAGILTITTGIGAVTEEIRADEHEMTAGKVLAEMSDRDRFIYIAGIVEGLAYARFVSDGKTTSGMGCIYNWFYEAERTADKIDQAFGEFPDYLPGAVVAALAKRACGT